MSPSSLEAAFLQGVAPSQKSGVIAVSRLPRSVHGGQASACLTELEGNSGWRGSQEFSSAASCSNQDHTSLLYPVGSEKPPRMEVAQALWAACSIASPQWLGQGDKAL